MGKIIIVADLGHFKAYRVVKNPLESPRVELIENYDSIEAHGRFAEKVTDTAGRFGMAGGRKGAAKGYGEPHHMELEMQKKVVKLIAGDINAIIAREGYPRWYLAAEKRIHSQVLENLNPEVKTKLVKKITSDLTKTKAPDILARFA
ncbi:MAG: host attachment protein [Nitrospiraceae bacterium]|nr:host attachment protein [Nitrospiraceae bacterium]